MTKYLKSFLLGAGVVFCIIFVIFVINQTAQVVELAKTIHPAFGRFILYGLLVVYTLVLLVPIVVFVKLPKAMRPPANEQSAEFETYLKKLSFRLTSNPNLVGTTIQLGNKASVEGALKILDSKAEEIIKTTASTVFVTTAISQNGNLDALTVLIAQSRMVWRVAHIYNQRPSFQELIQLYMNVFATIFLAAELEDIVDISEQIEPIISSSIPPALAGSLPMVNRVVDFVANSTLDGAANAFLTLRVGVVAKKYCTSLTALNRKSIRRFATLEAASMLGPIVLRSAGIVSKAIMSAAGKWVGDTSKNAWETTKKMGAKINPFIKKPDEVKKVDETISEDNV